MKYLRYSFYILLCFYLFAPGSEAADSTTRLGELSDSFEALALKVSPAVVQILSSGFTQEQSTLTNSNVLTRQRGVGAGVILDPEGFILTNAHVLQGARRLQVLVDAPRASAPGKSILKPKARLVEAKVVGLDIETDLAVLKISQTGLPHLELGDSDSLKPGQLVLAFGSPFGLENSVSLGIVSAVARQLRAEDPMIYIQTDAPINPGNSGGPLVDTAGRVVGINTAILSQSGGSEGIGFAAPSNIVRNVFKQIREKGRVYRGEAGIDAQTITPIIAEGLSLQQDWGVIVGDVKPGSSADKAGLQIGDIILSINGKTVENARQLDVNLYRYYPDEVVKLEVLRGNNKAEYSVSIQARSEESNQFSELFTPQRNIVPRLGLFCIELDDKIAKLFPMLRKQYGVVVAGRVADAPYWAAQFLPGDVIHTLNGKFITSLKQFREMLEGTAQDAPVVLQVERGGRLQYIAFELE